MTIHTIHWDLTTFQSNPPNTSFLILLLVLCTVLASTLPALLWMHGSDVLLRGDFGSAWKSLRNAGFEVSHSLEARDGRLSCKMETGGDGPTLV